MSKVDKAEEMLKKLNQSASVDVNEQHDNRVKAAKQWVSNFMAIIELDGLDKCQGQKDIEDLLVASWETKANAKDDKVKSFLSKLG